MRTLFTIHAGEFLVGSGIEEQVQDACVWLPSSDTGIDLVVTNSRNTRSVTLQFKYSRDFVVRMEPIFQEGLRVKAGPDPRCESLLFQPRPRLHPVPG